MEPSTGHHHFAGFWSRAAARIIDLLIIIAAFNLIYLLDRLGADAFGRRRGRARRPRALEGPPPGEQLEQEASKRPDVGPLIDLAAPRLLEGEHRGDHAPTEPEPIAHVRDDRRGIVLVEQGQ